MGLFRRKAKKMDEKEKKTVTAVEELKEETLEKVAGGVDSPIAVAAPKQRVTQNPYDEQTVEGAGKDD